MLRRGSSHLPSRDSREVFYKNTAGVDRKMVILKCVVVTVCGFLSDLNDLTRYFIAVEAKWLERTEWWF